VFEAVYNSPWHHPAVAWLAAPLAIAAALATRRRGAWLLLLVLLDVEIALDAWLTGGWPPIAPTSPWSERAAVLFVVLGDWRFFYLVERQWRTRGAAAAIALAWALIIPLTSYLTRLSLPGVVSDSRHLFLFYEAAFLPLAYLTGVRARRRLDSGPVEKWLRALTAFEVLQYAGWALADVVILRGRDWGFALRLIPNVLYYAAFVPFAILTAPREARA
jgi:hypothetical protein